MLIPAVSPGQRKYVVRGYCGYCDYSQAAKLGRYTQKQIGGLQIEYLTQNVESALLSRSTSNWGTSFLGNTQRLITLSYIVNVNQKVYLG